MRQFALRQRRCQAAKHHVGDLRHANLRRNAPHLAGVARRFDERDVGARLRIGLRACNRGVDSFDRARIGPRDDLQILIDARVDRGLDLLHHLGARDHLLAAEVPALFRKDLVLDLDPRGAGALKQPDRPPDIERIAEAGIRVRQDRNGHRVGNGSHMLRQRRQVDEPDVRHAHAHVRDSGAGDIERLETMRRNHAREQRIRRSRKGRSAP